MNRTATPFLLVLACLVAPDIAAAGVPSPVNSTLPACMALCPFGDMTFSVTIRDLANNPVVNSSVVITFENCSNGHVFVCPQRPNDPYTVNAAVPSIRMFADATGKVTFPARIGGTGPAGCAAVFADGVFMRSYALASPDQNGNGMAVGIIDVDPALFAAKLGTVDPTADFDCSGGPVDAADEVIFNRHLAHGCDGFIDALPRSTWGSVKSHYR